MATTWVALEGPIIIKGREPRNPVEWEMSAHHVDMTEADYENHRMSAFYGQPEYHLKPLIESAPNRRWGERTAEVLMKVMGSLQAFCQDHHSLTLETPTTYTDGKALDYERP